MMKRKLLLFFVMLMCSIGTWAGPDELKTSDIGNWFDNNNQSVPAERVIYVKVHDSNQLKATLNELKEILTTADPNTLRPDWKKTYYNALDVATINNNQYSGMIAQKKLILKVVFEKGNGANDPETLVLTDDALAALNSIDVPTIDLQDANITNSGFSLSNPYVRNLILPDGFTKEQVTTAATGCANLGSAFSIGATSEIKVVINNNQYDAATITAYVKTPGTLFDATRRSGYESHSNVKLGEVNPYTFALTKVGVATYTGYPSARDYSADAALICDDNGHFVFDKEADENAANGEGAIYNAAVGGGTRSLDGTAKSGALVRAGLVVLDLGDAIITEANCSDLTFPMVGSLGAQTEKVVLPTYSGLKTIPADCMNFASKVRDICIPGNIEYIKTRAFNSSGANSRLAYVWTTGNDPTVKYDNGACFTDGADNICHDEEGYVQNGCLYGTFTLPPNLKLIERFAFAQSINVHDVYVLNTTAPECHVDAFSTDMFVGNNTYDQSAIVDGIITRDAYIQGKNNYRFIAMLHYPRTTGTPNTQRYTDPSREYSVATGERDGNGNMIYFPNQSEFVFAYLQGSYGYVWKAWDDARNWYDNELSLGFGSGFALDKASHSENVPNGQGDANGLWVSNTSEMIETGENAGHLEKWDRSFYDVTTGQHNISGEVSAPNGELKPYNEVMRRNIQLYPEAKSESSNYVYIRDDNGTYVKDPDPEFNGVFRAASSGDDALEHYSRKQVEGYDSCNDGIYVQDYTYDEDPSGDLVRQYTESATGNYVQDFNYVEDNTNGTYYHPFAASPAPADINSNNYDPTQYYYPTASFEPIGGDYVNVWNNYVTDDRNTWPEWARTNDGFIAEFNTQWENGQHYTKEITGYTQCQSTNDVYNHQNELYKISENYAIYSSEVTDFIAGVNDQLYSRTPAGTYHVYNAATDANETRYALSYRTAVSPDDDNEQHYTKNYITGSYRLFNPAIDESTEARYCPGSEDYESETPITYTIANDYRGWHQFVLVATAHNSTEEFEPLRSFISDNDWWTICEPYDLRYSDMVKFFGYDRAGQDKKIPYLSKLMYVVRDVENQKITLMFSKNLMEYMEYEVVNGEKKSINEGTHVHGWIDNQTKWPATENGVSIGTPATNEEGTNGYDPIILHAGVPYLIKPNLQVDAQTGNITATRQFDVYKTDNADLYNRLHAAQEMSGTAQKNLIYNGIYTVPSYVVGSGSENIISDGTSTITMKDGSSFTYKNSTNASGTDVKPVYGGEVLTDYEISDDFTYSFVGSFYKSVMPQYCYFLGWNSDKNCATFWYSSEQDETGWNWNNETGVICPNFNTGLEIHAATSLKDPARWILETGTDIMSDNFPGGNGVQGAKNYTMEMGAANFFDVGEATGIREMIETPVNEELHIYNANGVYMGNSLKGLAKGIYIVNGKKYVVK